MSRESVEEIPRPYKWILSKVNSIDLLVWNMHFVLFWLICIVPTLLWLSTSVLWVLIISLWANIASHFAGALVSYEELTDTKGNLSDD
jgi:uncharacterized membrane protein